MCLRKRLHLRRRIEYFSSVHGAWFARADCSSGRSSRSHPQEATSGNKRGSSRHNELARPFDLDFLADLLCLPKQHPFVRAPIRFTALGLLAPTALQQKPQKPPSGNYLGQQTRVITACSRDPLVLIFWHTGCEYTFVNASNSPIHSRRLVSSRRLLSSRSHRSYPQEATAGNKRGSSQRAHAENK
ncbi:hypothetical protein BDV95DRAFT_218006 [Massariosphaeria phaeospora]|uniref:Uncharacterized protein n=1 Tax=Massariosphaeria phaeospora TaxID=100035 RepID=A0A7C8MEC4_9PLEO|nr:hypothetical protein BDV95DRAFT_218006 [Massariosphaeria phaeospora]